MVAKSPESFLFQEGYFECVKEGVVIQPEDVYWQTM